MFSALLTLLRRLQRLGDLFLVPVLRGKGVSCGRKINYIRCVYAAERKLPVCSGKPYLVTIEPVNYCNLKCPICETGSGTLGRPKRKMTFDEFRFILGQFDNNLSQMYFYFMGEPFLNDDGYRMVRFAADRGIWVTTCANAGFLDPEKLVGSGIAEVNFQIAGMTQEVHEIYRINSRLDIILDAIDKTIAFRSASGRRGKMKIIVGYILMKHNEHQVIQFTDYFKNRDIDGLNIIGTTARTPEQAREYMPTDKKYHRFIYEDVYRHNRLTPVRRPDNRCGWIYSTVTIMVNGDVVPCCFDPTGNNVLGNVFRESIYQIWNNERYRKLRRMVTTQSNVCELCRLCFGESVAPIVRY